MPQYDMCLKCASLDSLAAALQPFGLATPDGHLITASHDHALQYAGRVVQTPAEIDAEGNVTTEPIYYDGEYAILQAAAAVLDQIAASVMEGVEVVAPPAGLSTFGSWQERPFGPTLAELKAARIVEAAAACEAALAPYGVRFCPSERDTWTEQVVQARALLADPSLETPEEGEPDAISLLRTITARTGEPLASLAMIIVKNREAWLALSGIAIGQRQVICDQINAAETPEALAAINTTIFVP